MISQLQQLDDLEVKLIGQRWEDSVRRQEILLAILKILRNLPGELPWVEFKALSGAVKGGKPLEATWFAKYVSSLANMAKVEGRRCGWLVFGLPNTKEPGKPRPVDGTTFKEGESDALEQLPCQISDKTRPRHTFESPIYEVYEEGRRRVLMFQCPPAPRGDWIAAHVKEDKDWEWKYFGRHGSHQSELAEFQKEDFERLIEERLKQEARRDLGNQIEPLQRAFGKEFGRHVAFIGRKSVVKRVHDFIRKHDRGLLVIKGLPGKGKSAIIAHLAKELRAEGSPEPVTFFYASSTADPAACVRYFHSSLLLNHDLATPENAQFPSDSDELFEQFAVDPNR